jgi:hypothetical protein
MKQPSAALQVSGDQQGEFKLTLSAQACVRVAAVSQPADSWLEVVLSGPVNDGQVGKVASRAPLLLPKGGPVCVREPGEYVVRVRALRGGAQVWVGAWGAEVSAPISSR